MKYVLTLIILLIIFNTFIACVYLTQKEIVLGEYYPGTQKICVYPDRHSFYDDYEDTKLHEYCHYLIDNDYEHFCEE